MTSNNLSGSPRWLCLLMPRPEHRIKARDMRSAEVDLEQVRVPIEQLIDGFRWLKPHGLSTLYVALHPTNDGSLTPTRHRNSRHDDAEFVEVEFDWKAFRQLDAAQSRWVLYDMVLSALRSPKTVSRLGSPPLRDVQIDDYDDEDEEQDATEAVEAGSQCGHGPSVLEGVLDSELAILRPFPPGTPPGGSLELVEQYDRDLDQMLERLGGPGIIDSEINASFLRWVISAGPHQS